MCYVKQLLFIASLNKYFLCFLIFLINAYAWIFSSQRETDQLESTLRSFDYDVSMIFSAETTKNNTRHDVVTDIIGVLTCDRNLVQSRPS